MTWAELIDKQLSRLNVQGVAGAGIFALTCIILWMIAEFPALEDNELFKTVSQAIVVQGLVGLAMAAWFTRRTSDDQPTETRIVNTQNNPVPVEEGEVK